MQPTLLKIVGSNPIRIQPWFFKKGLKENRMEMPKQKNVDERGSLQDRMFDRLSQSVVSSKGLHTISPIQDPGLQRLRQNIDELELLQSRLEFMMIELDGLLKKI